MPKSSSQLFVCAFGLVWVGVVGNTVTPSRLSHLGNVLQVNYDGRVDSVETSFPVDEMSAGGKKSMLMRVRTHANDNQIGTEQIHGAGGDGAADDVAALTNDPRKSWEVKQSVLSELAKLPPIPRKFHIIWPDRRVVNSKTDMVKHGVGNMIHLNPSWEVIVHDYEEIDRRLQNSRMHSAADIQLLSTAHIVEKTDAFRLLALYEDGGFYQDIDRVYNVPMDEVIEEDTRLLLPTYQDINFAQDIVGTAPGNPIIKALIEEQSKVRLHGGPDGTPLKRKQGWVTDSDVMRMGPGLNFRVLSQLLFGRSLEQGLDMIAARHAIRKTWPLVLTKKEMWCDGLVVRPYDGCKQVSRGPLYKEYGVKSWADAVKKRWAEA